MPRRKPVSSKQRKADLQLKRAVKRGDAPATAVHHTKTNSRAQAHRSVAGEPSSHRLQSSFVKLTPEFLETTKHLASTLPLSRPIPVEKAVFPVSLVDGGPENDWLEDLSLPKRPKWKYDMEKKMVEKNEEAIFSKWLRETDMTIDMWLKGKPDPKPTSSQLLSPNTDGKTDRHEQEILEAQEMPRSPTHYERNLEVWRQLWRVTEISQVLLILLDSRCPPLHYPPSLHTYLTGLRPARKLILVLTKVDISGPTRAALWSEYLSLRYPAIRVVQAESYAEKAIAGGQGKRKYFNPHLPNEFRVRLIEALRDAHEELCTPPAKVKENAQKLKSWKPSVKRVIDWSSVLTAQGGDVGKLVGGALAPHTSDEQMGDGDESEPEYFTVGLIGQPNVGKSSLLNALFGAHKVKASRTPGKTKHFQTFFWTPQVRLVDCPGLIMPNFVPLEMQVLSGILPISQIASIPSCIHHALQFLPLEQIFGLANPATQAIAKEDKRTWRNGGRPEEHSRKAATWTAMDALTAYAEANGWVTAKAGRPDVNRAGNHILRTLAESRIKWAFWPPSTSVDDIHESERGIWIKTGDDDVYDHSDSDSDIEGGHNLQEELESNESEDSDADEVSTDDDVLEHKAKLTTGMFGALALDDSDEGGDIAG